MDAEPRYYVVSVNGSRGLPKGASFSVLDLYWGNREVAKFYYDEGGSVLQGPRAHAECIRLNALEDAWWAEVEAEERSAA